jgi:hypothetical protein
MDAVGSRRLALACLVTLHCSSKAANGTSCRLLLHPAGCCLLPAAAPIDAAMLALIVEELCCLSVLLHDGDIFIFL